MKETKDLAIGGLFVVIVMLVMFIMFSSEKPASPSTDGSASKISELESRITALEKDASDKNKLYDDCQKQLGSCTPPASECTAKDINYNAVCKKLGIGTMLRVDADRASDMVFQCVTDTKTVSIFFAKTAGSTVQILDTSYNNLLNITSCRV